MAETHNKKKGTAKRYGSRYGRSLREKVSVAERNLRSRQKCPYCGKYAVKRVAAGIWNCNKCDVKFTGAAYSVHREAKVEVTQK